MSNVILHLGLHKTATTTLQRQIFSCWNGLTFQSKDPDVVDFVRAAVLSDPIYFDAVRWKKQLARLSELPGIPVISNESLSGAMYAGVGKRGLDHRMPILQNLQATFPDARVLLVIRRQDTLARSLYRQYLKVGGTESILGFYGLNTGKSPIFPRQRFHFQPYIDSLHQLFPGHVLILAYEEFAVTPADFLQKLAGFLDLDLPNVDIRRSNETRLGSLGMEISRLSNYVFRSRLNPGGLLPGVPTVRNGRMKLVSLSSIIHNRWPKSKSGIQTRNSRIEIACRRIREEQAANNKSLDNKYRLDLGSHGYY